MGSSFLPVGLFLLVSAGLSCSSLKADRGAPEFSLQGLDGQTVSLSA